MLKNIYLKMMVAAIVILFTNTASSQETDDLTDSLVNKAIRKVVKLPEQKQQLGLRLGGRNNLGETIPELTVINGTLINSKVKDASFYLEIYYSKSLFGNFKGELSFGLTNRGSVTVRDLQVNDISNLLVYPIYLNLKYYPFMNQSQKFQPFFSGGYGFVYAKQTIQFSNEIFFAQYREASQTDFNYTVSGGFDWLLGNKIGLEFNTRYSPAEFSNPLLSIKNYDAVTYTIGIKYFNDSFGGNSDEDSGRRRRR